MSCFLTIFTLLVLSEAEFQSALNRKTPDQASGFPWSEVILKDRSTKFELKFHHLQHWAVKFVHRHIFKTYQVVLGSSYKYCLQIKQIVNPMMIYSRQK